MRNVLLKGVLLVALLTALATSWTQAFANGKGCGYTGTATNCTLSGTGNCQTSPCKKGVPCFFTACLDNDWRGGL